MLLYIAFKDTSMITYIISIDSEVKVMFHSTDLKKRYFTFCVDYKAKENMIIINVNTQTD